MLDFEGTGPEVRNNLNTPTPVVHSAVIYCMRAMLDSDIPLNAGCLVPLDSETSSLNQCPLQELSSCVYAVRIPKKSLLLPSPTAAVCAGNVLTSQRIVDVVLKRLGQNFQAPNHQLGYQQVAPQNADPRPLLGASQPHMRYWCQLCRRNFTHITKNCVHIDRLVQEQDKALRN